ncbi:MAG: hypothetical protein WDN27_03875 [Candidatus Saccharibacteria bacterium]
MTADTTHGRIGIGTAAPTATLHVSVSNTETVTPIAVLEQAGSGDTTLQFKNNNNGSFFVGQDASRSGAFTINSQLAANAGGSPAYIQSVGSAMNAGAGHTVAQAFSGNVASGHAIVVAVTWDSSSGANTFACADGTNTYNTMAITSTLIN